MAFTEREEKVLRLAFDTRTPENEAIAAFLAARRSIPFSRLCDAGSSENVKTMRICSVPHNCFFLAFDLIYYFFNRHSIYGGSVNLVASESSPESALFGDIVITYPYSENNHKIVTIVANQIADESNRVKKERNDIFSSFSSGASKKKPKETHFEYSYEYKTENGNASFESENNNKDFCVRSNNSIKMSFLKHVALVWFFASFFIFLLIAFLLFSGSAK